MDPNAALAEIRRLAGGAHLDPAEAEQLAELVTGLDDWLSKGGFLPDDWAR